ncbi:MAG TPA: FUSC family protein, partial [Vicinamibacterales bacterium]|nr:FUSC family protein [Vicinamibacterales bacterium]
MRARATRASRRITTLQLSIRAATAGGLAVAIAQWSKLPFPVYALIAAVLVMDLSPLTTRQLAWQRMAGTLIGATVGAVLSYWLPSGPLAIGVSVLLAMLLSHVANVQGGAKVT